MDIPFLCGRDEITLRLPDNVIVYESHFPAPAGPADELVAGALSNPVGSKPLAEALSNRRAGDVVVVVSDITRPIPYASFLSGMLSGIEAAGVDRGEILILIGTGMHRPSTAEERVEMFGCDVAENYRIVDHIADDNDELAEISGQSWSGSTVRLNKHFVNSGFRIITGLVEPHFMAGFSGGRKAVCPGLSSLETLKKFHGYEFLASDLARAGNLAGNPLHEEALSVAKLVGVDFSLNVVMNHNRQIVRAFAGELEAAHLEACRFAAECTCREVPIEADLALTSSGGYPLYSTFYQCAKGMVSCIPAVRQSGVILAFGACSEGVGSPEFTEMLVEYSGRMEEFLIDISKSDEFTRDQWGIQIQTRALRRVGEDNLYFVTSGIKADLLNKLSVTGQTEKPENMAQTIQALLDERIRAGCKQIAVFPEGPYCVPISK